MDKKKDKGGGYPKFKFKGKDLYNQAVAGIQNEPTQLMTPDIKRQLVTRAQAANSRMGETQAHQISQRLGGDTSSLAYQDLMSRMKGGMAANLGSQMFGTERQDALDKYQLGHNKIQGLLQAVGLRNAINVQQFNAAVQQYQNQPQGGIMSMLAPFLGGVAGGMA
jgi:hypothetical protein